MTSTNAAIRHRSDCSVGEECPSIDRREEGWWDVTGYSLDSSGHRDGDREATVRIPSRLIPELTDRGIPNLGEFVDEHHRHDFLRVQTLDQYDVASDGNDYEHYLAGAPFAMSPGRARWAVKLRADADRGRLRRTVHVVREPLADYLRYQFEWGYTTNAAAGMDIRILQVRDTTSAEHLLHLGDFGVIDRRHVIRYQYGADGIFHGAVQAGSDEARPYAALAELAWEQAVPFDVWWNSHPHYHRVSRVA